MLLNGTIDVKKIGMPLYKRIRFNIDEVHLWCCVGLLVTKLLCGYGGICGDYSDGNHLRLTIAGRIILAAMVIRADAGAISILSLNDGPFLI